MNKHPERALGIESAKHSGMAKLNKITPELRKALDSVIPLMVCTCGDGDNPNISIMSQLYYINEQQVALSYQFMNKTWRNLLVNPVFTALVLEPEKMSIWRLRLEYLEEKTEGPIFEEMEMQILALSTPENISFSLHSALICKVIFVEEVFEGSNL
jgi:hypothetical protein